MRSGERFYPPATAFDYFHFQGTGEIENYAKDRREGPCAKMRNGVIVCFISFQRVDGSGQRTGSNGLVDDYVPSIYMRNGRSAAYCRTAPRIRQRRVEQGTSRHGAIVDEPALACLFPSNHPLKVVLFLSHHANLRDTLLDAIQNFRQGNVAPLPTQSHSNI